MDYARPQQQRYPPQDYPHPQDYPPPQDYTPPQDYPPQDDLQPYPHDPYGYPHDQQPYPDDRQYPPDDRQYPPDGGDGYAYGYSHADDGGGGGYGDDAGGYGPRYADPRYDDYGRGGGGDAVPRPLQASFDPQPARADVAAAAYGYGYGAAAAQDRLAVYPGGEAGPPAPRVPLPAAAAAFPPPGGNAEGGRYFSAEADFVGTEYPRPPAPQFLAAAAGYAGVSKSPPLSFASTAVRAPSVSSSATYAAAAPPPIVPAKGRTLLKDRYNPNGPLEGDDGPAAYRATARRGRRRGCSKKCCCVFCVILLLLVGGLVAAFFLLFKQPDVRFLGVEQPPGGQPAFSVDQFKFSMNFQLKVGVKNPNILGVTFSSVEGEARFKGVSPTVVGSGSLKNLEVPKNSDQVVLFPFSINYDPANDPGSKILLYVAKSCGLLGGTKGKLEIDYTIAFSVSVLSSLGIKPAFSSSASFDCPLANGQTLPIGGLSNVGSLLGPSGPTIAGPPNSK